MCVASPVRAAGKPGRLRRWLPRGAGRRVTPDPCVARAGTSWIVSSCRSATRGAGSTAALATVRYPARC
eukprot:4338807-Prymnesium_polylepis.1